MPNEDKRKPLPLPCSTINEEWQLFAQKVGLFLPSVPDQQRKEMMRAFYGGQFSCLAWQVHQVTALEDDEAMKAVQARQDELKHFFEVTNHAQS